MSSAKYRPPVKRPVHMTLDGVRRIPADIEEWKKGKDKFVTRAEVYELIMRLEYGRQREAIRNRWWRRVLRWLLAPMFRNEQAALEAAAVATTKPTTTIEVPRG